MQRVPEATGRAQAPSASTRAQALASLLIQVTARRFAQRYAPDMRSDFVYRATIFRSGWCGAPTFVIKPWM